MSTVPLMTQGSDEPPCDTATHTDTAQQSEQQQSHQVMCYQCILIRLTAYKDALQ
jgi:hypothetical protein